VAPAATAPPVRRRKPRQLVLAAVGRETTHELHPSLSSEASPRRAGNGALAMAFVEEAGLNAEAPAPAAPALVAFAGDIFTQSRPQPDDIRIVTSAVDIFSTSQADVGHSAEPSAAARGTTADAADQEGMPSGQQAIQQIAEPLHAADHELMSGTSPERCEGVLASVPEINQPACEAQATIAAPSAAGSALAECSAGINDEVHVDGKHAIGNADVARLRTPEDAALEEQHDSADVQPQSQHPLGDTGVEAEGHEAGQNAAGLSSPPFRCSPCALPVANAETDGAGGVGAEQLAAPGVAAELEVPFVLGIEAQPDTNIMQHDVISPQDDVAQAPPIRQCAYAQVDQELAPASAAAERMIRKRRRIVLDPAFVCSQDELRAPQEAPQHAAPQVATSPGTHYICEADYRAQAPPMPLIHSQQQSLAHKGTPADVAHTARNAAVEAADDAKQLDQEQAGAQLAVEHVLSDRQHFASPAECAQRGSDDAALTSPAKTDAAAADGHCLPDPAAQTPAVAPAATEAGSDSDGGWPPESGAGFVSASVIAESQRSWQQRSASLRRSAHGSAWQPNSDSPPRSTLQRASAPTLDGAALQGQPARQPLFPSAPASLGASMPAPRSAAPSRLCTDGTLPGSADHVAGHSPDKPAPASAGAVAARSGTGGACARDGQTIDGEDVADMSSLANWLGPQGPHLQARHPGGSHESRLTRSACDLACPDLSTQWMQL
jgi:hypothetical protein